MTSPDTLKGIKVPCDGHCSRHYKHTAMQRMAHLTKCQALGTDEVLGLKSSKLLFPKLGCQYESSEEPVKVGNLLGRL